MDIVDKIDMMLGEVVELPIEIGDTILGGKFKNRKIVVKDISWTEKGDLQVNGKGIMRVRIPPKKEDEPEEPEETKKLTGGSFTPAYS